MKKILLLLGFGVLAVFLYLRWQEQPAIVESSLSSAEVRTAPGEAAAPRYPIPAPPATIEPAADPQPPQAEHQPVTASVPVSEDASLLTLNDSNSVIRDVLTALVGDAAMRDLLKVDEIIRRFVVTIDNLPNKKLPRQHVLVTRVAGSFQVQQSADGIIIDADNAVRYAPFLQLATQVDVRQLVALYVRHYALFQEAYAELGVPGAYFNDRLVDVIEHLLNTPVVDEPIKLVQPKVFYEYADADLEARSAGQKILLRMGSAGAEQLKEKLREIRRLLIEPALLQDAAEPSDAPAASSPQSE